MQAGGPYWRPQPNRGPLLAHAPSSDGLVVGLGRLAGRAGPGRSLATRGAVGRCRVAAGRVPADVPVVDVPVPRPVVVSGLVVVVVVAAAGAIHRERRRPQLGRVPLGLDPDLLGVMISLD